MPAGRPSAGVCQATDRCGRYTTSDAPHACVAQPQPTVDDRQRLTLGLSLIGSVPLLRQVDVLFGQCLDRLALRAARGCQGLRDFGFESRPPRPTGSLPRVARIGAGPGCTQVGVRVLVHRGIGGAARRLCRWSGGYHAVGEVSMRSTTASSRQGGWPPAGPTRRRLSAARAGGPRSPSSRRRTASRVLRSPGRADRRTQRSDEALSRCRRAHPVSSAGRALLAFLVYRLGSNIRPVTRQAMPQATTATSSASKLGMSWALTYPTPGPRAIRTRASLETGFVMTVG